MKILPTRFKHVQRAIKNFCDRYFISGDECYLYFYQSDKLIGKFTKWEMLLNGEKYVGNDLIELNNFIHSELIPAIKKVQGRIKTEPNKSTKYRLPIFTNGMHILQSAVCNGWIDLDLFAPETDLNRSYNTASVYGLTDWLEFRCTNAFALGRQEEVEKATNTIGAESLEKLIHFVMDITGVKLYKVKYSIGHLSQKEMNKIINRNKNEWHKLLRSRKDVSMEDNLKILQILYTTNASGQLGMVDTRVKHNNVISYDISSAYASALCLEHIFPATPLSIKPICGGLFGQNKVKQTINTIESFIQENYWFIVSINTNTDFELLPKQLQNQILFQSRWYRRDLKFTDKITLINPNTVLNFTKWDYLTNPKAIQEIIQEYYNLCPKISINIVYSTGCTYLPESVRTYITNKYSRRALMNKDIFRDIYKTSIELITGKGLQFKEINEDLVKQERTIRHFNIAIALSCIAYTKYRINTDFKKYNDLQLYWDTDGIKFDISSVFNQVLILNRVTELNNKIYKKQEELGYEKSNMGIWKEEYILKEFVAINPKQYLGIDIDNNNVFALAGCKKSAVEKYLQHRSMSDMIEDVVNNIDIHIQEGSYTLHSSKLGIRIQSEPFKL